MSKEKKEASEDLNQTQEAVNNEQQESARPPQREESAKVEKSPEEMEAEVRHIINMAEQNPSVKDLPEYQEMVERLKAIEKSKTQVQTKSEEESNEEEQEQEEQEEEQEEQEESNEFDALSDEDDAFGLKSKKKTKYKFKDEKDVTEFIKKKFSVKDYPKFFESVDKWRNDSQKLAEVSQQQEEMLNGLGSLPQPIKNAIQSYANNEDWRSAFLDSTSNISYDKNFESLDKEDVVKHYFKDKYKKLKDKLDNEDIDEDDYQERISDFYDSSKTLFETEKKAFEKRRAELLESEKQKAEALKSSAISSVNSLKDEFPNFNSAQLQRIKQHLVNGDIESLFVVDGKYSEDAAKKIALALYGDKILKAKIDVAKRTAMNESKEEFFQRGNKDIRTTNSQQGYSKGRMDDAVKHLETTFTKDPYS